MPATLRSCFVQPVGADLEEFDVGRSVHEAFDRVEDLAQLTVTRGHHRHADRSSLPLILMVDFRDRDVEAVAQSVYHRPDGRPLDLQLL